MTNDDRRDSSEFHSVYRRSVYEEDLRDFHSFNTYQFDDYDKYVCEVFSPEEKAAWREMHFPEDCKKAFAIGEELMAHSK